MLSIFVIALLIGAVYGQACDYSSGAREGSYTLPVGPRGTYGNNFHCNIVLEGPPDNHVVAMSFTYFDVEYDGTCASDYLQVNFDNIVVDTLCGNLHDFNVIYNPDSAVLNMTFISNSELGARGFAFTYRIELVSGHWASSVLDFSSEFGGSWSASDIIGPPDVYHAYGDIGGAWQQLSSKSTTSEFIIVKIPASVYITGIDIYETYQGGHVTLICAESSDQRVPMWSTSSVNPITTARIFSPKLQEYPTFLSDTVRIVTKPNGTGWVNIDAVEIYGTEVCTVCGQWVSSVVSFSSEYGGPWSAAKVVGLPDVYPRYGDMGGAWQQNDSLSTSEEYIDVQFTTSVYISDIDIYETYRGGHVAKIEVLEENNNWFIVWNTSFVTSYSRARRFSPVFQAYPTFMSNRVRITTMPNGDGWVNIDAVNIYGTDICTRCGQWVSSVYGFSSEFGGDWTANETIGSPDVYPRYGDMGGAWQQESSGCTDAEWIVVQFQQKVYVTGIEIYETYRSGHVTEISVGMPGSWFCLWSTSTVTPLSTSRIFSPTFLAYPTFLSNHVNITTRPSGNGWVNIDAVKIYGTRVLTMRGQWANKVIEFSSEFGGTWAAAEILGAPDVYPHYGDRGNVWQQQNTSSAETEWIIVDFPNKVYITGIEIYETFNSGHVTMVQAMTSGSWFTMWSGTVNPYEQSRIFSPILQAYPTILSNCVKITTEPSGHGWVNIDAVKLHGTDFCTMCGQWVSRVASFSSEFGDIWSANEIIGSPDVYPEYGDMGGAWQQQNQSSTEPEWIVVQFPVSVYIKEVDIYETYNSGHVTCVETRSSGSWFVMWSTPDASPSFDARIFTPTLQALPTTSSNMLRITTKPSGNGWVNIDAVKVYGTDYCASCS